MTPIPRTFSLAVGAMCLCLFISVAEAAIVLQGTRVIFAANVDEVMLRLKNTSDSPVLVQSWLDDGQADQPPEDVRVPFVVQPAVTRVDAAGGAALRIKRIDPQLPEDRESLFWLNVMEMPARRSSDNAVLQFAFRTRIKLFYRPVPLIAGAADAADRLSWRLCPVGEGGKFRALEVVNPTPYYLSFGNVEVLSDGHPLSVATGMVAPYAKTRLALRTASEMHAIDATVRFEVINDYGGRRLLEKPLTR